MELLIVHTTDVFISTALAPALAPLQRLLERGAAERVDAALAAAAESIATRLPEALAVVKLYLSDAAPVFAALQAACLEPLARVRAAVERPDESGRVPAVAAAQLVRVAELRQLVERTCADLL